MKRPQGEEHDETPAAQADATRPPEPAPNVESPVPETHAAFRFHPHGRASDTRSTGERLRPPATGVRSTFVLAPEDLELLQGEKFRRRMAAGGRLRGSSGDFSSLVREAIRKTYGKL